MEKFLNKTVFGDSVEMMREIDDNSIDLTVTSPPYDKLRSYEGHIKKNDIKFDEHFSFPFIDMVEQLYRITKDGGIVVWVVNDQIVDGGETGNSFRQALKFQEIGFKIYDTMIYHKNGAAFPESGRYSQVFEYMFVFLKGDKPKTVNLLRDKPNRWAGSMNFGNPSKRGVDGELKKSDKFKVAEFGYRYNVWYIKNGKGYSHTDPYGHDHPASYPESLAEDHILSWSNPGDIVLDPMCGGGTTLKMAKMNNRNYIGIDNVENYIEISDKRLKKTISYNEEHKNSKEKFIISKANILLKRKNNKKI